ncbi:MAG: S9 family peptidase [Xanthomonadales bacterium]|nr:S9 family peptidase [Xanthomonadales bacterium]
MPARCSACLLALLALSQHLAAVERRVEGQRISEDIPAVDAAVKASLDRFAQARGATLVGWLDDGSMLITTRFGNTEQVHRVAAPMAARTQLTFEREPVRYAYTSEFAPRDDFLFLRDVGGSEFWQLFRQSSRQTSARMISPGGRSRNQNPLFSRDGRKIAFSSTARNGSDSDLLLHDLDTGSTKPLLAAGGAWLPLDFSPDGKELLVLRYVSINETYPGTVNLDSGELRMFPVDGERAAITAMRFAPDGHSVFYISDELSPFRTLRQHDLRSGRIHVLSADQPWDVSGFALSRDGRRVAYATNEDGFGRLFVRDLPSRRLLRVPDVPRGVIGAMAYSHDSTQLAVSVSGATAPSDVFTLDRRSKAWTRWTHSESGPVDTRNMIEPTLVRFPTFDEVDGAPRRIPAFYYRPRGNGPFPVVISIHGGPESQALPQYSAQFQFMLQELGIAVLVPNVRGSAGYGKDYLKLDNGLRRKDSVRDIGALLDWIAAQGDLDTGRVGVMGGSYGGYMVLASMVDYPDRIAAGIDVVGISDFSTFLQNTQIYRQDLRRAEYGDERDPEVRAFFEQISPLRHAGRIASPLMVAQGRNDPRVPLSESEQIVAAVRARGQPVWYLEFADEGHGFAKKANRDHFDAVAAMFWKRFLLGSPAPSPAAANAPDEAFVRPAEADAP